MQIEILFFNLHKTGFVVKSAFNFLLRHGSFKRPKGAIWCQRRRRCSGARAGRCGGGDVDFFHGVAPSNSPEGGGWGSVG